MDLGLIILGHHQVELLRIELGLVHGVHLQTGVCVLLELGRAYFLEGKEDLGLFAKSLAETPAPCSSWPGN